MAMNSDTPEAEDPHLSRTGFLASRIALLRNRASKTVPLPSTSRQLCPHCDQDLSQKTFRKHRKLFCRSDGSWVRSDKIKETKSTTQLPVTDSDGRHKAILYLCVFELYIVRSRGSSCTESSNVCRRSCGYGML